MPPVRPRRSEFPFGHKLRSRATHDLPVLPVRVLRSRSSLPPLWGSRRAHGIRHREDFAILIASRISSRCIPRCAKFPSLCESAWLNDHRPQLRHHRHRRPPRKKKSSEPTDFERVPWSRKLAGSPSERWRNIWPALAALIVGAAVPGWRLSSDGDRPHGHPHTVDQRDSGSITDPASGQVLPLDRGLRAWSHRPSLFLHPRSPAACVNVESGNSLWIGEVWPASPKPGRLLCPVDAAAMLERRRRRRIPRQPLPSRENLSRQTPIFRYRPLQFRNIP